MDFPPKTFAWPDMSIPALAGIVALLAAFVSSPAGAQDASSPLGGASSIEEVYQDWRVRCVVQQNLKQCTMSQQQNQQGNGQLVIAAEFAPAEEENSTSGVILLPFGLVVTSEVTLQIDDKPPAKPLAFRTCLPAGCVVPAVLDEATMSAARSGATMKIGAITSSNNQPVAFSISLKGFAQAFDRLRVILAG